MQSRLDTEWRSGSVWLVATGPCPAVSATSDTVLPTANTALRLTNRLSLPTLVCIDLEKFIPEGRLASQQTRIMYTAREQSHTGGGQYIV